MKWILMWHVQFRAHLGWGSPVRLIQCDLHRKLNHFLSAGKKKKTDACLLSDACRFLSSALQTSVQRGKNCPIVGEGKAENWILNKALVCHWAIAASASASASSSSSSSSSFSTQRGGFISSFDLLGTCFKRKTRAASWENQPNTAHETVAEKFHIGAIVMWSGVLRKPSLPLCLDNWTVASYQGGLKNKKLGVWKIGIFSPLFKSLLFDDCHFKLPAETDDVVGPSGCSVREGGRSGRRQPLADSWSRPDLHQRKGLIFRTLVGHWLCNNMSGASKKRPL